MKIVHVAPFYVPIIGGMENVVKHIAKHMAAQGHKIHVITHNRMRKGRTCKTHRNRGITRYEEVRKGVNS